MNYFYYTLICLLKYISRKLIYTFTNGSNNMKCFQKREQYLRLCRRVLRNTNYNEHRHRYDDIHKCFIGIFSEEMEYSVNDRQLICDITNEFPHIFKM